jgi:orotidine-5'-phosphate decarboxylase
MMTDAVRAAGEDLALVAVTVLTSHTPEDWGAVMGRERVDLAEEVTRLTAAAVESGLAGVVCSPREIAQVKDLVGDGGLIVTPGVRRDADAPGDQRRVATPGHAAASGATHLVVGRPVLQANDPNAAFRAIAEEARCER